MMFIANGSYSVSELMMVQVVVHSGKKKIRNPERYRVLVDARFWRKDTVLGLTFMSVPFSDLL